MRCSLEFGIRRIFIEKDEENDKVRIYVDKGIKVEICHEDAGLSGICGPDVWHDLDDMTNKVLEEEKEKAFSKNTQNLT